jgi:hypothetical protein
MQSASMSPGGHSSHSPPATNLRMFYDRPLMNRSHLTRRIPFAGQRQCSNSIPGGLVVHGSLAAFLNTTSPVGYRISTYNHA